MVQGNKNFTEGKHNYLCVFRVAEAGKQNRYQPKHLPTEKLVHAQKLIQELTSGLS